MVSLFVELSFLFSVYIQQWFYTSMTETIKMKSEACVYFLIIFFFTVFILEK